MTPTPVYPHRLANGFVVRSADFPIDIRLHQPRCIEHRIKHDDIPTPTLVSLVSDNGERMAWLLEVNGRTIGSVDFGPVVVGLAGPGAGFEILLNVVEQDLMGSSSSGVVLVGAGMDKMRDAQVLVKSVCFGRADPLASPLQPSNLCSADGIDASVPCLLNPVLTHRNRRHPPIARAIRRKDLVPICFRTQNVANLHLDVPVSAESALVLVSDDMLDGWVTVPGFADAGISFGESGKVRDQPFVMVLDALVDYLPTVTRNVCFAEDAGAVFKLGPEPGWHLVFVGVRAEICVLCDEWSVHIGNLYDLEMVKGVTYSEPQRCPRYLCNLCCSRALNEGGHDILEASM
jgi:hypothetical protein